MSSLEGPLRGDQRPAQRQCVDDLTTPGEKCARLKGIDRDQSNWPRKCGHTKEHLGLVDLIIQLRVNTPTYLVIGKGWALGRGIQLRYGALNKGEAKGGCGCPCHPGIVRHFRLEQTPCGVW